MKSLLTIFVAFTCINLASAQPANDDPCSATPLPVDNVCNYTASSNTGATNTAGAPSPGCAGTPNNDVWFSFVVPANGIVSINTLEGSITDGGMALYSGNCNSLTLIECDDDDSENGAMPKIAVTGLTPGTTLYVRFWEYGGGTGTFSICISTMPDCGASPPAGNDCANATPICDLNGYCGNTSGSYTDNSWTSGGFFGGSGLDGVFCGTIENNSFLSFVASSTTISFDVWVTSTTMNYGIQIFIFQSVGPCSGDVTQYGPCYNPSIVEPGGVTITANGLTIGDTYYIMIDGQAGDVCDYVIAANSGFNTPVEVDPLAETICDGDQVILTASGGDGVYTWDANPDLNTTSGAVVTATPSGVGVYDYIVNSSTGNVLCPASSSDTATITVTNCGGCSVTATNSGPICLLGGTIDLFATNVVGGSYSWTGPNGFTSTDQNPIGITPPNTPGSYDYTVSVDAGGGVNCTSTTTLVVNANPTVDAGSYAPICDNSPLLALSGTPAGGAFNGTGVTGNNFDPTFGTQIITYTYTDVSGCTGEDTTTITVTSCSGCQVVATNSGDICSGNTIELFATNVAGATYSWTGPNSFSSTNQNVAGVTPPITPGSYTYTVTADLGGGVFCESSTSVEVFEAPSSSFTADIVSGCAPLTVTFTAGTPSGGATCSWNFGDGNTSTDCGLTSNTFNAQGCYDITYTITENGCSSTITNDDMICVDESAIASFTMTPDVGSVQNSEFEFINGSSNASSYFWDFGDGTASQDVNPTHTYPEQEGNYLVCLLATNPGGCNDSICQAVVIDEELIFYLPNTFTPDDDQHNQIFSPIFTSGFDPFDFHLSIFNRWGELIWESYNAEVGWDGTYAGELVPDGTYVWKIDFKTSKNDERRMEVGHVNLIR